VVSVGTQIVIPDLLLSIVYAIRAKITYLARMRGKTPGILAMRLHLNQVTFVEQPYLSFRTTHSQLVPSGSCRLVGGYPRLLRPLPAGG